MKLSDYPDFLTQTRNITEGNFIFCLYKNPELIPEFTHIKVDESNGDIRSEDGMFYMSLASELSKKNYVNFDELSLMSFLEDKPTLKHGYETRGGYNTISEFKEIIDDANIDAYFDELCKSNILLNLYEKGFNVKLDYEKFKNMNSEEVMDWFEYQLSDISIGSKTNRLEVSNISEGYDKFIEEWAKGSAIGFKMGFGLLNYHCMGVHPENLTLVGAHTNCGKSSFSIPLFVIPSIEEGNDVVIISNEMNESQFRQILLATVMFNITGGGHLNRTKLSAGKYTEEDFECMKKATEWLDSRKGQVHFVELFTYDSNVVKKIVKKYSKLGVKLFLYDVLKSDDDSNDKSWGLLVNTSKDLFMLAKSQKVAVVATVQLSPATLSRRFLDVSCIGRAKMMAEVCSQVLLFRPLRADEKDPESSKYIKIWNYHKGKDGEEGIKEQKIIKTDEDGIVLQIVKNRDGRNDVNIVYKRNLAFNKYTELGVCDLVYDGY